MNNNSSHNCLNFIAMLYLFALLISLLFVNRIIGVGNIVGSCGTIIFPLTYLLLELVTEVYGYSQSRRLIWYGLLIEGVFVLVSLALISFPGSVKYREINHAYNLIVQQLPRVYFAGLVSMACGLFLSTYIISKTKILFKGRLFLLRSVVSTLIGEAVLTIISILIIFYGRITVSDLLELLFISYLFKLILIPILVFPTNSMVVFLKKIEGVNYYDKNTNFNPFSIFFRSP